MQPKISLKWNILHQHGMSPARTGRRKVKSTSCDGKQETGLDSNLNTAPHTKIPKDKISQRNILKIKCYHVEVARNTRTLPLFLNICKVDVFWGFLNSHSSYFSPLWVGSERYICVHTHAHPYTEARFCFIDCGANPSLGIARPNTTSPKL